MGTRLLTKDLLDNPSCSLHWLIGKYGKKVAVGEYKHPGQQQFTLTILDSSLRFRSVLNDTALVALFWVR